VHAAGPAPALVLVVHGTRAPAGARTSERLAHAVQTALPDVPVGLAYADVHGPTVTDVLARVPGPAVVLPVFLAAGYHVRVDLPAQLAAVPTVTIAAPVGPARPVVAAVHDRLRQAGLRPGDRVVLAAAGSSDPRALADVRTAASRLSELLSTPVPIGYCATAEPALPETVAQARRPGGRVAVASWLLAPGHFHRTARQAGADLVSAPIAAHPHLVTLLTARYRKATSEPPLIPTTGPSRQRTSGVGGRPGAGRVRSRWVAGGAGW
jgi:sirohydrochlorin ferrochelatase